MTKRDATKLCWHCKLTNLWYWISGDPSRVGACIK
jgi:hypothetical protein